MGLWNTMLVDCRSRCPVFSLTLSFSLRILSLGHRTQWRKTVRVDSTRQRGTLSKVVFFSVSFDSMNYSMTMWWIPFCLKLPRTSFYLIQLRNSDKLQNWSLEFCSAEFYHLSYFALPLLVGSIVISASLHSLPQNNLWKQLKTLLHTAIYNGFIIVLARLCASVQEKEAIGRLKRN